MTRDEVAGINLDMSADIATPDIDLPEVRFMGVKSLPEITAGDDISTMIARASEAQGTPLRDGDILVVTQKIVSKAEGRTVDLSTVEPSDFARRFAEGAGRDPRVVELVLRESIAVVKMDLARGILITETRQGFVCANSGIDSSNVSGDQSVTLLPENPDRSARQIMEQIRKQSRLTNIAVIITDTFGRAWREGHLNFAIGVAGMDPFMDYRGQTDVQAKVMGVTRIAIADEIAAAAELVMGKVDQVPAAIARGIRYSPADDDATGLIRNRETDLFR